MTVRQLFVLEGGALMIDTPVLWEAGVGTPSQVVSIRSPISSNWPDLPLF
jgi:hypothetical protein